ncbi:MAG: hypothetical protein IKB25_02120 [Lentisphaeria bacterium]|nr:hypothetical protein [Lentisphaeria bacterium]
MIYHYYITLKKSSVRHKGYTIKTLRWHFDFCVAKIGMPQKGLKKDDGVRGRREKVSSKVFPFFPDHKSTFIGNRAKKKKGSVS